MEGDEPAPSSSSESGEALDQPASVMSPGVAEATIAAAMDAAKEDADTEDRRLLREDLERLEAIHKQQLASLEGEHRIKLTAEVQRLRRELDELHAEQLAAVHAQSRRDVQRVSGCGADTVRASRPYTFRAGAMALTQVIVSLCRCF